MLNPVYEQDGVANFDELIAKEGDQGDWVIDIQGGIAFLRPYGFETYGIDKEEVDNVIEFHTFRFRNYQVIYDGVFYYKIKNVRNIDNPNFFEADYLCMNDTGRKPRNKNQIWFRNGYFPRSSKIIRNGR